MSDQELLARIECNPRIMVGKPVIRGTRLTVEFVLGLLGHGASVEDILDEYDGLEAADIQACHLFAAQSLSSQSFMPLVSEPA